MLRNYIKIAWRNFLKNKAFSLINVSGLAIGLTCFLLIGLYVLDELNYDHFHTKADRIYRINSDLVIGGTELHLPTTSDMMGQTLKKDYPTIENYTRIYNSNGGKLIKLEEDFISEGDVAHVDSTFFDVFAFQAIEGDLHTALAEPNTTVITKSMALKYFGTTKALGKSIETDEQGSTLYRVTAVMEDMPLNSHFRFDFLFSMANVDYDWGRFTNHNFHTYVLLQEGVSAGEVEAVFPEYIHNYVLPDVRQVMDVNSLEEFEKAGNRLQYSLIPLTDIHLHSNRGIEFSAGGDIQNVYIFSFVALFILIIACVNFMNLTTARSAGRAREVGVRKVLGTEKKNLVFQFLTESIATVSLAFLISLGLVYLVLPLFNGVAAKTVGVAHLFTPTVLPFLIALPLLVGILAGSYPAFFLSGFQPILVLKGMLSTKGSNKSLRSALVVFQFCISIVLIVVTIVVYQQLQYIQTKNLGFNKEEVLIINGTYVLGDNKEAYKNELLKLSGVQSGSYSSFLPVTSSSRSDQTFSTEAVMTSENMFNMQRWRIDHDYIPTMGMELMAGRNFSRDFGNDTMNVIINQSAANLMGYEDPIGQKLYGTDDSSQPISYTIIGVVKNFHFESLKKNISPLCFFLRKSDYLLSLRVKAADIPAIVRQAEDNWRQMAPGKPFSYRFLDDSFDEMYRAEQRIGKLAVLFSVLAIFIVCLGLFGLTTYMAEQRIKEIGVRKVLGSSVTGIVRVFSADFIKLVLIALAIAIPLSWYFMDMWLQDFAYRISIQWWVFAAAGILAVVIALVTVSFQAIKAATADPAKSLRTE